MRKNSAKKVVGSSQGKSINEAPGLQLQGSQSAFDDGSFTTPQIFELEAAAMTTTVLSSEVAVAHEWTSNRGRHAPIPLGSPAELPAYPDYIQLAQNRGPQPQSTLRVYLTEHNLIPSGLGPGLSLERSLTMGNVTIRPDLVAHKNTLARHISAPATSRTHQETYVPVSPTTGSTRGLHKPKPKPRVADKSSQVPVGIAELPSAQHSEPSLKISSPRPKTAKTKQPQMPDIHGISHEIGGPGAPLGEPPTPKEMMKDKMKDVSKFAGDVGRSAVKTLKSKAKSQVADGSISSKSIEGPVTPKTPKPIKAKDSELKATKPQDLSRGVSDFAVSKPTPTSSEPRPKGQARQARKESSHAVGGVAAPPPVHKSQKTPKVSRTERHITHCLSDMTQPANAVN